MTTVPTKKPAAGRLLDAVDAAHMPADDVVAALGADRGGLSAAEASRRAAVHGANEIVRHRTGAYQVLGRQLRSPLLILLGVAAVVSAFVGERTDAVIIGAILALSIGLGFVNEFRAERSAEALHDRLRHRAHVLRDGVASAVDVTTLVPGDIVRLSIGMVVPADLRLLDTTSLECDESILTGESVVVRKSVEPVAGSDLGDLTCCALMGTVVKTGNGLGVVVATGRRTAFGEVAAGLAQHRPATAFQVGLSRFSSLLARFAIVLTVGIFTVNLILHRPIIDALLFSLAIAVGITPQLLPAVVTTSLATGSHRLAARKVLVKRLVGIEDLGNVDVLFTDKTGTLTEGRVAYAHATRLSASDEDGLLRYALACSDVMPVSTGTAAVADNPLDAALYERAGHLPGQLRRVAELPFDHDRQLASAVVVEGDVRLLVVKGSPEAVLARCATVPEGAEAAIRAEYDDGGRVIAIATRAAGALEALTPADERDLGLTGLLVFTDRPKESAREALRRLRDLEVTVKVITGDAAAVAVKVCADLDMAVDHVLTGHELADMDDAALASSLATTTIYARVSPEQKARIVRAQRAAGGDVAFLGDGVNDALALHASDVGISVDDATDVARDAADVILLEKDLGVLADGVVEGRRIFANTLKYVLMGASSNFGNMFSAAGASAFLPFLPMTPGQILLNNLLYDTSQLAIPTDRVDDEQLSRPRHWDIGLIQRFMLLFGPMSSIFDFLTFAVLLRGLHAPMGEFRTGWFLESLTTQSLVVFAIRTRFPAVRSRPSVLLTTTVLAAVVVGFVVTFSPLAHPLGFAHPSASVVGVVLALAGSYLVTVEWLKRHTGVWGTPAPAAPPPSEHVRRVHRRAARFAGHDR
jgi:Mg2+-importing ATPase